MPFKSGLAKLFGVINMLIYGCIMAVIAAFAMLAALMVWLIPWRPWRRYGSRLLAIFPELWIDAYRLLMPISPGMTIHQQGHGALSKQGWYLIIANHQSWLDIVVLGAVFNHKIPFMKFFMKKELLWSLPLAGWFCYMAGYPFMQRITREDIRKNPALKNADVDMTRKACATLKEWPSTLVNFIEGTRFTPDKKQQQQSPYRHLLKPKAGGIAMVLHEMQDCLSGIINVTIHYDRPSVSFWDFAQGKIKQAYVRFELIPIEPSLIGNYTQDRSFRRQFQQWLNQLWQQKDQLLHEQVKS